ncbi:electron transfer flavoprotein subunit alpha [Endocarpon pusillum Z07020]|uniref:Probable electron transfer flavoprotein subunit alpha n=1 Tax=Endocarpon pusillum (strain Z07020 / HMAS-L-300199) TaxID=1263415 RepID=U1FY34_ENDPU|nr:electron transfer flavoprotein subunit alpha [Endocarpon pusillum Z07020]ERF69822.1 electron transfer flavoprotein subunit alpha [Endocarpon pusillum Z07020]
MLPIARYSALRAIRLLSTTLPRSSSLPILRLLSTLAVLEQIDGKLNSGSLCAVTAGRKLGGSVTGFVAGSNVKVVAEQAAKGKGMEKVVMVDNGAYDKGLAENFAPLLVENIKKGGYTHVIASHSAFGKSLLPRVAALLDVQQISDVMSIQSEDTFVRPIYAGNAILTVQSTDPIKILTVRTTSFPVSEASDSKTASIEEGTDPKAPSPTEWISEDLATSDRPELATAGRVVSGGRGLKSKEEFDKLIPPLADALGAAIGASRAAVDSGFADNSLQVGQTGKNVAPQLYLCAGISGAIQHLAGMKDSKVIAAINKDADAPILQVADVGLVGDLFKAVPELTEKLKKG